jgi:hypothetical protein
MEISRKGFLGWKFPEISMEISRNFNGNFQGENFHFGNFHSLTLT